MSNTKLHYFEWIKEVCTLLDKPPEYGAELIGDLGWFSAWDDGLSPSDAIKEKQEWDALNGS